MQIAWNDGSGDSLYLTLLESEIKITSDPNNSYTAREKTLVVSTTDGSVSQNLHVTQKPKGLVVIGYGENDTVIGYGDDNTLIGYE